MKMFLLFAAIAVAQAQRGAPQPQTIQQVKPNLGLARVFPLMCYTAAFQPKVATTTGDATKEVSDSRPKDRGIWVK